TYKLTIKFPRSIYPDHFFTVDVDKKDKGYQLKKNAEKGWSMQDLQTMIWIRADRVEQGETFTGQQHSSGKSKDAFALMMAAVV
ncbi:hypothetical protein, partial [Rhizobium leguminosarum]|uniref:hypothetical protein n=1 Tax=Rhizobium leguminosarum TaxID=384 RepID=UPI003F9AAC69